MLFKSLWRRLLRVGNRVVIESVAEETRDGERVVVASVRLHKRRSRRGFCGRCGRLSPGHDAGAGRRRWRSLDQATTRCYIVADAPRVACKVHGVTVGEVPWARHDVGFTRDFDDQVAWLAVHSSKKAITELMRIAWRTVGAIVERVSDDARARADPLDGLTRIGIDEISYRKGHRYLTVVVDHDSGRLVWATPGRNKATVSKFFNQLGKSRTLKIRLVSADAAGWIGDVVASRCLNAKLTMDAFHVVKWATDALDVVRRQVWNDARRAGQTAVAKELKGARYALWRNPEDLSVRQAAKLADIARTNGPLYRAYLLKEQLRRVFALRGQAGINLLDRWLAWAQRCRIEAFVTLARTIRRHRTAIDQMLITGTGNAIVESTNTKLRVIHRRAYGFRTPKAMIALGMLALGGLCPDLPGR
ncbi:MAG: ISL3 family transposase, partial [Nitriliruptor sp.]|uniref:ISL3 family transposase n=1 Tax=Nitriliruptor sp. TaxID=2448056 RepID=UPI0034A02F48